MLPLKKISLIMLGDGEVGKTSILSMFTERRFNPKHLTTLGLDSIKTEFKVEGQKPIPVVIWDTAGQERFRTITYGFYKNAHGVIIVYDISNRHSFDNVKTWLGAIQEHASD